MVEKRNKKSAHAKIFSELLLTEKLPHYLQMNAISTIDF